MQSVIHLRRKVEWFWLCHVFFVVWFFGSFEVVVEWWVDFIPGHLIQYYIPVLPNLIPNFIPAELISDSRFLNLNPDLCKILELNLRIVFSSTIFAFFHFQTNRRFNNIIGVDRFYDESAEWCMSVRKTVSAFFLISSQSQKERIINPSSLVLDIA